MERLSVMNYGGDGMRNKAATSGKPLCASLCCPKGSSFVICLECKSAQCTGAGETEL